MSKTNLIIFLGFLLLSCASLPSTPLKGNNSSIAQVMPENQGQNLPVSARAYIGNESIDLEVAVTPEQQSLGLMYRSSLPKNHGMLFSFSEAQYAHFWMKNVLIDLDIVFLQDGVVRAVFADVPPCFVEPCPVYGPSSLIDQVIELAGGQARELGIKVGDKIEIKSLSKP